MNRVLVGFALVTVGIISLSILAPATEAGPIVRINLNYSVTDSTGPINYFDVQLVDDAPITVANFLQYVNNHLYDNTIIHRDVQSNGKDFVMQGGGYTPTVTAGTVTALSPITKYAAIQNEYSATRSNVRGTIAMAKLGTDPNSATNEWFVNLGNNAANLDNQNGGFTVFGQVLGSGMTLIDAISQLPKNNLTTTFGSAFTDVPKFNNNASFVTVTSASVLATPTPPIPTPTGKLSGFVYVDVNHNGIMDGADYAIADAQVSLMASGGSTASTTVYSSADGSYHFNNLGAGTFSIQMQTPCTLPGQDGGKYQSILDKDGNIISTGTMGTVLQNAYNNVTLADGQGGTNFNFAEAAYPVALISSRLLSNTAAGIPHTQGVAVPGTNVASGSVLDFGKVLVGAPASETLTVSNLGGQGSTLSGDLPGASGEFGSANASTFGPITPNETASRDYTYTPTTRGTDTQDLSINTSGGNVKVTLSGTGVAPVGTFTQSNAGNTLVGTTGSVSITVKNTGDGNLSGLGDSTNLIGNILSSSGTISGPGGAVSLKDDASATFSYTYTPTVRGANPVVISTSFSNGNSDGTNSAFTKNVTLSGTGVAPVGSLTSNTGYALVGGATGTASITVKNAGDGNLSGLGDSSNLKGTLSGASGSFSGAGGSVNLLDSAVATFNYTFAATVRGVQSTTVSTSFSNGKSDGTNAAFTQDVTLTGQGVAPEVALTKNDVQGKDGFVLVGNTDTASIVVKNAGDGNLSGVGDSSNLKGNISGGSGDYSGAGGTVSLKDGESKTFSYTYKPTLRGIGSTTVSASFSNGSTDKTNSAYSQNISFSAIGVAPVQSVDTNSADAGLVRIGTTAMANVMVNNIGDGNLSGVGDASNLKGTVAAGTGSFSGAGGSVNLADQGQQLFSYTYTPTAHAANATAIALQFTNGSADNKNLTETVTANLKGQGVGPVYSTDLTGFALDFGTVPQASLKSLFLNVSNTSTDANNGITSLTDLTLRSATITGADSTLFSLKGFTAGAILHQGDLLNLEIAYNGTGTHGDRSATLTIVTDEGAAYGSSGDVFNYSINASLAPEPGSLALLAMGGLFLGGVAWRRRAKR